MVVSDVSRKIKIKRGQIFIKFGFEKKFYSYGVSSTTKLHRVSVKTPIIPKKDLQSIV